MVGVSDKSGSFRQRMIEEIASGVYHNGDRMPSEREMCQRYNLSRTTIRQALAELEEAALIIRRNRSGAFIAANAAQLAERLLHSDKGSMTVDWLMMPSEATNPLLQAVFSAAGAYLDQSIRTRVCFLPPEEYVQKGEFADIVIVCNLIAADKLELLQRHCAGILLLNQANKAFHFLTPDHFAGGQMMAEYALRSGARHIGCVANITGGESSDFDQRFLGIKSVFEERRLQLTTAFLQYFYYMDLSATSHYALDQLLHQDSKLELVLCTWDLLSIGIYNSLAMRGRRVPDDIGVIGFDDQCYAQYMTPALTTIKYPAPALGFKVAEFLNHACRSGIVPTQELVRPILIERDSVKILNSTDSNNG